MLMITVTQTYATFCGAHHNNIVCFYNAVCGAVNKLVEFAANQVEIVVSIGLMEIEEFEVVLVASAGGFIGSPASATVKTI